MGGVDELPGTRPEDPPVTFLAPMPSDDQHLSGCAGVPQGLNGVSAEDEVIDHYFGKGGGPAIECVRY